MPRLMPFVFKGIIILCAAAAGADIVVNKDETGKEIKIISDYLKKNDPTWEAPGPKLEELAKTWGADEVDWLSVEQTEQQLGSYPAKHMVLRIWWD